MTETANKFIDNRKDLWHMLGAKYKKVNPRVVIVQDEYGHELTWQRIGGEMICLQKRPR
jgi:hypothetical protein